ncbi:hypothetical protein [uncultured Photobacterium sp.]|uniref:hypothetical protein n=1 Tax=uncultured Photobacterium sp. TaxID=173973 RepID=UPI002639A669|nr:hypothetical protein [uncultured Photobacterium sp.]
MLHYLSEWHHYVYGILTFIFIGAYVLHFLPQGKLGRLKGILETETILMLVLIFVAVIAARVEHTGKMANKRWEQATALFRREGFQEFKTITSTEQIFRELSDALSHTKKEIWATGFRPDTPKILTNYSSAAAGWYEDLDQWANAQSGRTYLRLVGLNNEATYEWFQEECTKQLNISNRQFKGLEWDEKVPFINMIIFDNDEVFLMFRSDPALIEQTIRYRIRGAEMTKLAREWFQAMWEIAQDCNKEKSG